MKKLIKGIVDFRQKVLPSYKETFARLALGQQPDTLFVACSDSRVVPNLFASTDPGDLFVIRNVGNLIPPCGHHGHSVSDESEGAAIEFSLINLDISDIIICGHSECAAMNALCSQKDLSNIPHFQSWLRHGEAAVQLMDKLAAQKSPPPMVGQSKLQRHNLLSQCNVLQQLEHMKTYGIVREKLKKNKLQLHAWWFDVATADVYAYDESLRQFVIIDEKAAEKILAKMPRTGAE